VYHLAHAPQEMRVVVSRRTAAPHRAIEHLERGEKSSGAVALIVELAPLDPSWSHQQLGAVRDRVEY
jgi:hypothetical protein